jgi:hypothetical protein
MKRCFGCDHRFSWYLITPNRIYPTQIQTPPHRA